MWREALIILSKQHGVKVLIFAILCLLCLHMVRFFSLKKYIRTYNTNLHIPKYFQRLPSTCYDARG
jgi:hypothetical protein